MLTSLRTVRRHLGYTAAQVIDLLTCRADALNLPIAARVSLKTKRSRRAPVAVGRPRGHPDLRKSQSELAAIPSHNYICPRTAWQRT